VDALPGGLVAPFLRPGLGLGQVNELLAGEEVPADILDTALDSGLVLGVPDPGGIGGKPAVLGIIQPTDGEPRVHRVGVGHDRRGVIRHQHPEHATEKPPRRLAPLNDRGQGLGEGQPHEQVPRADRGEDQRVGYPAAARARVIDQAHPGEVNLTLHPRLAVRDPHRGAATPAEPAPLDTKPVHRAVGHQHTPPGQQISDLDHGQVLADPLADLLPLGLQRLPSVAVTTGAGRTHRRHHLADHLIGQLPHTAATHHPGRLGGGHIAAGRLTIHPRLLRHRAQPGTTQPRPQHLTHLSHRDLPEHHSNLHVGRHGEIGYPK
jgi:hypothetical protein